MPTSQNPHGELACVDAEALLAESEAENLRLREENRILQRRLGNAIGQKNVAIDEAVSLRSRPDEVTPVEYQSL